MIKFLALIAVSAIALQAQGRRGGGGGGFRPAPPVVRPMPGIPGSPIAPFGGFQPSIVSPGVPIPAFGPSFPQALNATIQGRPFGWGNSWNRGWGGGFGGFGRMPVYVPVPVGGFGWGYGGTQTVVVPQAPPEVPVVIINQSYQPERLNPVFRDYSNTTLPAAGSGLRVYDATVRRGEEEAAPRAAEGPVVYLIALKDSTVVTAVAYWADGDTLHYVTPKQTINKVSFSLLDRELSERLNRERGVELRLPR